MVFDEGAPPRCGAVDLFMGGVGPEPDYGEVQQIQSQADQAGQRERPAEAWNGLEIRLDVEDVDIQGQGSQRGDR